MIDVSVMNGNPLLQTGLCVSRHTVAIIRTLASRRHVGYAKHVLHERGIEHASSIERAPDKNIPPENLVVSDTSPKKFGTGQR